ncbi:MAG: PstS family phosphate ABC transporter substrate-binding protein [Candidatus Methylomirabilia bacterium]
MKKTFRMYTAALCGGLLALATAPAGAQVVVDKNLPEYKAVQGISGSIKSVGSDTLNNLMAFWAEGFKKQYPNVTIEIEGKGSTTAPPALIAGTSTLGPMSRPMKGDELGAFEKRYGYKPTGLSTAIDMLAVYVHKDNPITGLSFQQVDAIFSKSRKQGGGADITTWGQVGLTGKWQNLPISLYGRNSASGTYGYFKEHTLAKGDYKDSVKEQPGSSAVVQGVASDLGGIGYSGIGYKTADVRAVPLAMASGKPVPAESQYGYSGEYPLSRFLLIYINYKPGSQLDPLQREFVKYVFSREGQEVVAKDGFLPVTAKIASETLKQVGITP